MTSQRSNRVGSTPSMHVNAWIKQKIDNTSGNGKLYNLKLIFNFMFTVEQRQEVQDANKRFNANKTRLHSHPKGLLCLGVDKIVCDKICLPFITSVGGFSMCITHYTVRHR